MLLITKDNLLTRKLVVLNFFLIALLVTVKCNALIANPMFLYVIMLVRSSLKQMLLKWLWRATLFLEWKCKMRANCMKCSSDGTAKPVSAPTAGSSPTAGTASASAPEIQGISVLNSAKFIMIMKLSKSLMWLLSVWRHSWHYRLTLCLKVSSFNLLGLK